MKKCEKCSGTGAIEYSIARDGKFYPAVKMCDQCNDFLSFQSVMNKSLNDKSDYKSKLDILLDTKERVDKLVEAYKKLKIEEDKKKGLGNNIVQISKKKLQLLNGGKD